VNEYRRGISFGNFFGDAETAVTHPRFKLQIVSRLIV